MEFQRKVLSGLVRTEELNVAKKLADYRATLSRQPSLLQWQYTINPRTLRRIKQQLQHLQGVSPVDDDENNAMKWLTKMRLLVSSVPFTNISTKRPRESSRIKRVVRDTASGYSEVNIEDWENFQALDLLDYYNLMNEKAFYEEQAKKVVDESSDDYILKTSLGKGDEDPIVFNSAAWMVIDLLPGTHEAQVLYDCLFCRAVLTWLVSRCISCAKCFNMLSSIFHTIGEAIYSAIAMWRSAPWRTPNCLALPNARSRCYPRLFMPSSRTVCAAAKSSSWP